MNHPQDCEGFTRLYNAHPRRCLSEVIANLYDSVELEWTNVIQLAM